MYEGNPRTARVEQASVLTIAYKTRTIGQKSWQKFIPHRRMDQMITWLLPQLSSLLSYFHNDNMQHVERNFDSYTGDIRRTRGKSDYLLAKPVTLPRLFLRSFLPTPFFLTKTLCSNRLSGIFKSDSSIFNSELWRFFVTT